MRLFMIAALFAAFTFLTTPALAGHKHSRSCGHYYGGSRGVSVSVATRWGGGSYYRDSRYRGRSYYDDRYYDKRYYKKQRKYRKRYARRRVPYCPRY